MRLPGPIQAVTFDVGGTLIRPWPSVGHVYAEIAARHGYLNILAEDLNRQFAVAWRAKKNFDHSRDAWLALVRHTFSGLLADDAVKDLFADLYSRFAEASAWRIFDEVFSTLEGLRKRGVKLGIISNWDGRLRPLLADLQLAPYFEAIVISIEVGSPKPSGEMFRRAASLLGMVPACILHVGDSASEDVLGAQSAGFQAMLLERKGTASGRDLIRTLDQVMRLL